MQPIRTNLTRDEMVALVTRICQVQGTESEIDEMVRVFEANCNHPDGSDLIFWPHGYPHDPSKAEPTVEQIVDKAMSGGAA